METDLAKTDLPKRSAKNDLRSRGIVANGEIERPLRADRPELASAVLGRVLRRFELLARHE